MHILDLLFPRRCVSCGHLGRYFCQKCQSGIEFTQYQICPVCEKAAINGATHPKCRSKYSLDGLTSYFRYRGIIRKAIKSIKYRFVSDLAKEFIDLIPHSAFSVIPTEVEGSRLRATHGEKFLGKLGMTKEQSNQSSAKLPNNITILIPIPLHPSRFRFRGFNQAEILGRIVAKRLNIPLRTDLLERIRKSVPQVEMKDRKKRLQNMEDVFSVNQLAMKQCNNESILLFDDVFTTGATLRSAANVLKRAGANSVWGITLAHG